MKPQTLQRVIFGVCVWAISQMFLPPATPARQARQDDSKAGAATPTLVAAAVNAGFPRNEATPPNLEIALIRLVDRIPMVNLKKIEPEKIASFFVRANSSERIQLSMRVVYKPELVEAVQQMVGQKVTPLVFTVSTLPNRQIEFDPAKLRFEQWGRIWQPNMREDLLEVLPLDDNAKFGGLVTGHQAHQGIVLLPPWMNPNEPITLCYGNVCSPVRFAEVQIQKY